MSAAHTPAISRHAIDDEVVNGTKWDSRILDIANVLKAYKKPVLLRIGGEMNGSWNGYHPWEFPKAFRKVVAMIRAQGAANVAFVWCYEPAGPGDFDEMNASGAYKWYPGRSTSSRISRCTSSPTLAKRLPIACESGRGRRSFRSCAAPSCSRSFRRFSSADC